MHSIMTYVLYDVKHFILIANFIFVVHGIIIHGWISFVCYVTKAITAS